MFSKEKLIHLLIIFFVSIVAIAIHGYQYAVTDQAIFIPYIHKIRDPSFFPGDILFEQSSATTSLFYYVVAQLTKFVDIQPLFFIAYLIFQTIFFFGIYLLSKTLTNNKYLAYAAILPFFIPKFIAGTSIYTFDIFFGYRSIGLLFFIYYLIFALQNKFYRASIFGALGILFHSLSIIPTLMILPVLIISNSKRKIKTLLIASVLFFSISSLLLFTSSKNFTTLATHAFDKDWLSIIKFRDEYLFPSRWQPIEWAAILFYLIIIILSQNRLKTAVKKNINTITIVSIFVFFVNFLVLEIFKVPLVAQFQLVRAILPLTYIAFTLTPILIVNKNKLVQFVGFLVFISLSLNIYWLFAILLGLYILLHFFKSDEYYFRIQGQPIALVLILVITSYGILNWKSYKNLNQKFQIPKPKNEWIDVQMWARSNTNVDEKFAVLPRQIGFRIFSERSIVADLKDGAVVMYDPQYAKKWFEIYKDFEDFYVLKEDELQILKEKYHFKYIVTIKEHLLNFDIAYKNSYYVVYKL